MWSVPAFVPINDANSLVNSTKNNLPIYFTLFQIAKVGKRGQTTIKLKEHYPAPR